MKQNILNTEKRSTPNGFEGRFVQTKAYNFIQWKGSAGSLLEMGRPHESAQLLYMQEGVIEIETVDGQFSLKAGDIYEIPAQSSFRIIAKSGCVFHGIFS